MHRFYLIGLFVVLVAMMTAAAEELQPLAEPAPAPGFQLEDVDGRMHAWSDYQGKVLIINFWASWCPPCVKEMPSLQRAWEQVRGEGIQVLGINMGESRQTIKDFVARFPVEFPLLMDRAVLVADNWGVKGLPVTYIIDSDGRIVFRVVGDREWDDPAILARVRALAKNAAGEPEK